MSQWALPMSGISLTALIPLRCAPETEAYSFAVASPAKNKQSFAIRALDLYATRLAKSLATIINVIDPEVIVLGGGLSNIEFLYTKVPQLWSKWVFSDKTETKLVKNKHGDSSGVRGAAYLWPDLSDEKVNT